MGALQWVLGTGVLCWQWHEESWELSHAVYCSVMPRPSCSLGNRLRLHIGQGYLLRLWLGLGLGAWLHIALAHGFHLWLEQSYTCNHAPCVVLFHSPGCKKGLLKRSERHPKQGRAHESSKST